MTKYIISRTSLFSDKTPPCEKAHKETLKKNKNAQTHLRFWISRYYVLRFGRWWCWIECRDEILDEAYEDVQTLIKKQIEKLESAVANEED